MCNVLVLRTVSFYAKLKILPKKLVTSLRT